MEQSNYTPEKKENNIFTVFLFRFLPYWYLFVLFIGISLLGAWVYIKYSTPVYAASSTIIIKDEKRGVDEAKMLESLNAYNTKKIVENEIVVLSSRALVMEVVDDLHLYAPVSQEGPLKPRSAYSSSPISIEVKDPRQITTVVEKVPFVYDTVTGKVKIGDQSYFLHEWVTTPYGILKFSKNKHKTREAKEAFFFSLYPSDLIAGSFLSNLEVNPESKTSTIINLSFKDEDPRRAENFLNTLTEAYHRASINEKNKLAANTLAFLEDRIKIVQHGLDSIERRIQQYRSEKGVIDLSTQGRLVLQTVGDNDRKVTDISMQLAALDEIEKYVVQKDKDVGIVPSTLGVSDPILPQLLQKLSDLELQYQNLRQTTGDNNSVLVSLKSQINQLRPQILENVKNQRQNLQASRENLSSNNSRFTSMLQTLPQKEKELLEISRQQAIKTSAYSFLLQKREETAVSYASAVADSRIVDKAQTFPKPVSPKKSLIFLGALFLGLILAVAVVSARELLSTKILFRSDVEGLTKVPIAAEIASVKHKHELVVNQPKETLIAEQFRHMRAALGLYGKIVSKKKILITSSIAGEGKSFIASNLALSLAMSGKKVVLIDADLRSPRTSSIFKLEEESGLAEYLEGNAKSHEIIKEGGLKNLHVIPAGSSSINATELLINGNLGDLLVYLEQLFDYVLIDTSPVDPVTDAYVLSEYCDKTLFVIRHGYTPKTMIQLLDENNKVKALKSLAIVFNGVKKRGFINGGYGFGYGYGYEYVYKERQGVRK